MPEIYRARKIKNRLPTVNPLSAYAVEPRDIHFKDQKANETILLLIRKHWITNVSWVIIGLFALFIPFLFQAFPPIAMLPSSYRLLVFIGWYLLLIAYLFERFLSWYFNVGIITDQRVLDIDFYGLLFKEISEAELDKIQDVTQQQVGAVRTVFDFGNIVVQTASEACKIEFHDIPHPSEVADLLNELT